MKVTKTVAVAVVMGGQAVMKNVTSDLEFPKLVVAPWPPSLVHGGGSVEHH